MISLKQINLMTMDKKLQVWFLGRRDLQGKLTLAHYSRTWSGTNGGAGTPPPPLPPELKADDSAEDDCGGCWEEEDGIVTADAAPAAADPSCVDILWSGCCW